MKIIAYLFLFIPALAVAQVGINTTGDQPHSSAMLDVQSTERGFLPPRMTTGERDAITDPAYGLVIVNTDTDCLEIFLGVVWHSIGCGCSSAPDGPSAATQNVFDGQIQWNWNEAAGASGYKYNAINDFSSATDVGTATNYTQTGVTCGGNAYSLFVWAYNECGPSAPVELSATTLSCPWSCGSNITVNHSTGDGVSPIDASRTYGTVSYAGKCWIDRNLGASQQAASANDNSSASAGWFWQFNRKQGYQVGPTPSWTITSIDENSDWTTGNDPCAILLGSPWRIPTEGEWNAANIWSPQDYNGSYSSALKLHPAGALNTSNGAWNLAGDFGYYWTSTQSGNQNARDMHIYDTGSPMHTFTKAGGLSVRCMRD